MATLRKYEILPHVADVRIRLISDDLQGLFITGLEAMNHILKNDFTKNTSKRTQMFLNIDSENYSTLLVDFLSEMLTFSHMNKSIYEVNSFNEFGQTRLKAEIYGYAVRGFDEDIKAVSYTEAEIVKGRENQYEAVIVMDI